MKIIPINMKFLIANIVGSVFAFGVSQAYAQSDADVYNATTSHAIVFHHPVNGEIHLFATAGNWYMMDVNSPQGKPIGEAGQWHLQGDQLCIDTAEVYPRFAGCGTFRLIDSVHATWDHPFAVGLPITLEIVLNPN